MFQGVSWKFGRGPWSGPWRMFLRLASISLLVSSTVAREAAFSSRVPFLAVAYSDRLPKAVALILASAGEGRAPLALNALFIAKTCNLKKRNDRTPLKAADLVINLHSILEQAFAGASCGDIIVALLRTRFNGANDESHLGWNLLPPPPPLLAGARQAQPLIFAVNGLAIFERF